MKLRLISFAVLALLSFSSCRDKLTGPPTSPVKTLSINDTLAWYPHPLVDGKDGSGNGHNGVVATSGLEPVRGMDRFGKDSLISYGPVTVTSTNGLDFTKNDSYTVSAWCKLFGSTNRMPIVSLPTGCIIEASESGGLDPNFGTNLIHFDSLGNTKDTASGYLGYADTTSAWSWHMITVVVHPASNPNSGLLIYVDSQLVGNGDAGTMSPSPKAYFPMLLGYEGVLVDDILILDTAASASWVSARFHEGGWAETKQPDTTTDTITHWSGPTPMPSGILGMCWVNGKTGYVCGQQGVIYETSDSGHTWQKQNQTATQSDLYAISFLQSEPNMGVAAGFGNGAVILLTSDAGNTWIQATLPSGIATIHDIITGVSSFPFTFAVGSDSSGNGIILYSNYWGYWGIARRTPKPLYAITDDGQINYLDQTDPMIAVGDGGQIFVVTTFEANPDSLQWADYSSGNENLRAISLFQKEQFTYGVALSDNGSTLWSTDFGKTWAEHSENVSTYVPNSAVYMAGLSEALISGSNIGQTLNGGLTWTNDNPAMGLTWSCISARDASHVAFLSNNGLYWFTP